jgi:8-oxo-dGTP pyrophosphatase MutT (NUDIX family)/GNAT superfamily N-acetyltransferase
VSVYTVEVEHGKRRPDAVIPEHGPVTPPYLHQPSEVTHHKVVVDTHHPDGREKTDAEMDHEAHSIAYDMAYSTRGLHHDNDMVTNTKIISLEAVRAGAPCPACSGTGEQGTGHECYACDSTGLASDYSPDIDNANPENGLLVGRDDARGVKPVTASTGRYYHSSSHEFQPGDDVLPNSQVGSVDHPHPVGEEWRDHRVWLSKDPGNAAAWTGGHEDDPSSPSVHVYEVRPHDLQEHDSDSYDAMSSDYQDDQHHAARATVVRRLHPSEWHDSLTPRTALVRTAGAGDPWYASASDEEIDAHPAGEDIRRNNLGEHIGPTGTKYRLVHHGRYSGGVTAHVMPSGRRAGVLTWFGGKHDPENPSTTHGVIHKVIVSAPHRRKGLASAMLDFAREKNPNDSIAHSTALSDDGRAWSEKKARRLPKENLDHLEETVSQEELDAWRPHARIFGPGHKGEDPRLFDGDHLKPEVRAEILSTLDDFWTHEQDHPHWQSWARVYFTGSEASHWYGNNDFDVLVGVDYDSYREHCDSHLRDEEIDDQLNKEFRASLNGPVTFDGDTFDRTWYVNPHSYDIRRLKPYAAYDVGADEWAVRPVDVPDDWGPQKFPESTWHLAEQYANEIDRISHLTPVSVQKQHAQRLFDHIHTDRQRAFSPRGTGVFDPGNVAEKYLDQRPDHPLAMLVEMKNQGDKGIDKEAKDSRFAEVGLKQDDDGWYVHTHRARSDSYESPEKIPQKDVDFIASTGALKADVPLPDVGVKVISPWTEKHLRKRHSEARHEPGPRTFPIDHVWGGQSYVDRDPDWKRDPEQDHQRPPTGNLLPNGHVMLQDGHHRLADAKERGDSHFTVHVQHWGYGNCTDPLGCEFEHAAKTSLLKTAATPDDYPDWFPGPPKHVPSDRVGCYQCRETGKSLGPNYKGHDYPAKGETCPECHGLGHHPSAAGEWEPVQVPKHQAYDPEAPSGEHQKRTLEVAKARTPGTHVFRGEMRPKGDDHSNPDSIGIHWSVRPEMAITGHPTDTHTPVLYHAEISHEDQAIPRSHESWFGKHRSLDSEAEVRFKPGAQVHVHGAYAWHGEGSPRTPAVPSRPGKTIKGWKYHPINRSVPIEHGRPEGDDLMKYPSLPRHEGMGAHGPDYENLTFTHEPAWGGVPHRLIAHSGDHEVGHMDWYPAGHRSGRDHEISMIEVYPEHQRRGVASQLLDRARQIDPKVKHSNNFTDDGRAWAEKKAVRSEGMGARGPDYDNLTFHDQTDAIVAHHPEYGEVGGVVYGRSPSTEHHPEGHLQIESLDTTLGHERRGVATALMRELERRHPGVPINHGPRTADGVAWAGHMYPGHGDHEDTHHDDLYYGKTTWTKDGKPYDPKMKKAASNDPTGGMSDEEYDEAGAPEKGSMDGYQPTTKREQTDEAFRLQRHIEDMNEDRDWIGHKGEEKHARENGYRRTNYVDFARTASVVTDEDHNKRIGGTWHHSNGRVLLGRTAVLSEDDQEARLRNHWFDAANSKRIEPVQGLVHGARAFAAMRGLPDPHSEDFHKVVTTPESIREVGRQYHALPEHDESAKGSFEAMRHDIHDQYHHLTNNLGVDVHFQDEDPYPNHEAMVHDLHHNNRLKVLRTSATGSHPFFSDEENDKFRAVHDAFGHAATGRGFDRHGEEAAYVAHSKMFSPAARPAMATETKGQNSYFNLNGEFGKQKVALLPSQYARTASIYLSKKDAEFKPATVSGVAVQAADTGRLLMIQRSNKDEKDPARGTWEFPGGHHEDGDLSSLHAGIREWEEEVGQKFPEGGTVAHTWRSGPYQGHLVIIPEEDCLGFHEGRCTTNPDDPDCDDHEQSAWWEPEHARKNPALRQEVKDAWPLLSKGLHKESRRIYL